MTSLFISGSLRSERSLSSFVLSGKFSCYFNQFGS